MWHVRVSKQIAQYHSNCCAYGRSKLVTKQRRQKYPQQVEHIQNEIDEYTYEKSND
jgi:hypothetical protein